MQIILLSGGSGKRLWPLSNEARSKQFLPLLEKEGAVCDEADGNMESMVQRVVRQIAESRLTDKITIATNVSQLDIITNQLGDKVDVVTEPERRDTFPAIALAASYLKFKKGCSNDEVVVVMPCDPYTESSYFETVKRMVQAVEENVADLVLMGVKPTYPSEKFGYIVPEAAAGCDFYKVQRFTEKPTLQVAEQLLSQGALWNGGVFAFRLGYMLHVSGISSDAENLSDEQKCEFFESFRNRYAQLPKISFDYQVAEKAESVAVVPFEGKWKDLGTWNTLTDEIRTPVIGNAVMGGCCENSHVINELHSPIYVDGLKDIVVAACPDGILVCSKKCSENIKNAVEHLASRPMYEERRWGTYRVLDSSTCSDGYKSLTKFITLKAGKNISYQIHSHRDEVWTFVDGEGLLLLDDELVSVGRGYVAHIRRGQKHAVKALTDLSFIEVQSGDKLVEEDITRLQLEWPESLKL